MKLYFFFLQDDLSVKLACQISEAAIAGGYASGTLTGRVASLAGKTSRKRYDNAERALHTMQRQRLDRAGAGFMKPELINVSMKVEITRHTEDPFEIVQEQVSMIPTWDYIRCVYLSGAANLNRALFGSGGDHRSTIVSYWEEYLAAPWGRDHHPIKLIPASERSNCVPIYLHLDGVEVHKGSGGGREWLVWSLASALVTGMPMLTKFVVAMVPAWRLTESSQAEMVHWISHRALPVLAMGEYNGVSIAGGWRFFWAGNKADWKAKVELNKEWRYYSCTNICQLCFASTGEFCNYTDMSENADHWAHKISFRDYLLQCQTIGREPTPCIEIDGFTTWRNLQDGMHAVFHKGVGSDFGASLVADLISEGYWFAESLADSLKLGFLAFRKWANEQKIYESGGRTFTWSPSLLHMTTSTTQPSFSDTYKCADVRLFVMYLCEYVVDEALKAVDRLTPYQRTRARCAFHFRQYWLVLKDAGPILTPAERDAAVRHGRGFLKRYSALASAAVAAGRFLYKMRRKIHQFDHIVRHLKLSRENPRFHETWMDETLMGNTRRCLEGCHATTMSSRGADRWILHLYSFLQLDGK